MNIQPVSTIRFKSNNANYENPINRKSERNLAILSSAGTGALVGLGSAGIATCFLNQGLKHRYGFAALIGAAFAAISLALTLPPKLYDTKVKSFAKEKEMNIFSRDRELKSNLLEEVDKEVKDEGVSLEQKINHFATMQMANNASGVMIKGM